MLQKENLDLVNKYQQFDRKYMQSQEEQENYRSQII